MTENIIVQADAIAYLRKMPACSVDLIVTSPPYNLGMDYDCDWDDEQKWASYFDWCEEWLVQCYRVLKDDGRMCLNHYLSCGDAKRGRVAPLMTLNERATQVGFHHHGVAIWNDATVSRLTAWGSWLSASSPYVNSPFEGILLLYKNSWKKQTKGVSTIEKDQFIMGASGTWKLKSVRRSNHPAPYHLDLALMCINLLSYKGDLVLDPFVGSGTTCVAAALTGRRYIGVDLSEKYVRAATRRVKGALRYGEDPLGRRPRAGGKGRTARKDQRRTGRG